MHTLLIAEPSDIFAETLKEQLQDDFLITHCADGESALEALSTLKPDALIINLTLSLMDGLTLLQETPYKPPIILAYSFVITPYIQKTVYELGAQMLLCAPTPSCLSIRILDLVHSKLDPDKPLDHMQQVTNLLRTLNFPTHRIGYEALRTIIVLYKEDPTQNLSKILYPAVAKICSCQSSSAVEQSIRRLISNCWSQKDSPTWSKYFNVTSKCPTNLTFISRLSEELV